MSRKLKKYVSVIDEMTLMIENGESLGDIKSRLEDKIQEDDEFDELYQKALYQLADKLKKKPPEIIYAEYYCAMMRVNKELDYYINNLDKAKGAKEGSFALKAKIDLLKELHINSREKLGLLNRVEDNSGSGGINILIQNMSNEDKKAEMLKFSKDFAKLVAQVEKQGAKKLSDIDIEPIHYGESAFNISNDNNETTNDSEESE